jgi:regulatory protein
VDAYTTALNLLSRRELSRQQLRERLSRRKFDAAEIEDVIQRLTRDGTLDDHRVALASARVEAAIKRRGRRRVLRRVRQLGIAESTAQNAVDEVFRDVDELALLDHAIERRLKGGDARSLDARGVSRLVRGLIGQGFDASHVYARLRTWGNKNDE